MVNIGYNLSISTNSPTQSAKAILDDSGDTRTGKQVIFNTDSYAWGIGGLTANRVYFGLGAGSSIQVLGSSPPSGQTTGNTFTI